MDSPRFEHGAAGYPVSVEWVPLTEGKSAERPEMRTEHNYVAVAEKDPRVQRFAQTGGIRDDRVQNRLKIARRFADDAQHLCGSGLLLKRLGERSRARLYLVEQPHVLDSDDGLVGEGLDQLDLLVGERLYGIARESDHPDRGSLAHQRYAEQGAPADFLRGGELIVRIGLGIDNMHGLAFKQGSSHDAVTPGLEWDALKHRYELR